MNEAKPQPKKVVIMNDTSVFFQHGCNHVMHNLRTLLARHNCEITGSFPALYAWSGNSRITTLLKSADFIIVNAEGNLHDGHHRHILELGPFARAHGVPIYLVNALYENNPHEYIELIKSFNKVIVRESLSHNALSLADIPCEILPDLSYYDHKNLPNHSRVGLASSDSVLPEITNILTSRLSNLEFIPTRTTNYLSDWHKVLKSSSRLRPHQKMHLHGTLFLNSSLFLVKKSSMRRVSTPDEYKNLIASFKGVFAARFHTLCFAIMTKTPFIAISSNSYKIEGMLKDIGISDRINHIQDLENKSFEITDFTREEVERIDEYLIRATEGWDSFLQEITK